MKNRMRNWLWIGLLVAGIGWTGFKTYQDSHAFEIIKNLEIFTDLYKKINSGYVDELDPGVMMDRAVDAMLRSLDPYTRYISEADIESHRLNSAGTYEGFGAGLNKIGDYSTIVEVYEKGPAQQAGLIPGDKIIKVEDVEVKGMNTSDLKDIINGMPSPQISLTIQRYGQEETMEFILDRKQVSVKNVPFYGLIGDDIGYIVLTTFTADASKNVRGALADLKTQNPQLKGVILDLRDNGGGLLSEAIRLSNLFIPQGELVVSTRNKLASESKTYKTPITPFDLDIPLAVLINERSASASEIVSGVIQDYDRGVLVGKRSFGKGLVQVYKPLKYGTQLKMTISKYYIPSGRCIQSSEYGPDGEPIAIEDERRGNFKTAAGRAVQDGGGITPDVIVEDALNAPYIKHLQEEHVFMFYATKYYLNNPNNEIPVDFYFNDIPDFKAFVKNYDFVHDFGPKKRLIALKESLASNYEDHSFDSYLNALEEELNRHSSGLIDAHVEEIKALLTKEIVSRYRFRTGVIENSLHRDKEVLTATDILRDSKKYQNLLSAAQ